MLVKMETQAAGGAGELISQELSGTAGGTQTGSITIHNGYLHVTSPDRYWTSFNIFTFENGVCTQQYGTDTYTYVDGLFSISVNSGSAAYGKLYFKGYMTD